MVQKIREMSIIKILEYGVRLCLKLQTSHIASMYFEAWLDQKKRQDILIRQNERTGEVFIDEVASFNERKLREYMDLITLSCILLASKINEQNNSQPTINEMQRLIRGRYSFPEFVGMEKFLIVECLNWELNVTSPYHFSDCIQGMGSLFWSDFEPFVYSKVNSENSKTAAEWQYKMVLFLIQYRKYVNYFLEQSLIFGLWGNYEHDTIALASILIARFEIRCIDQVRWKKKAVDRSQIISLKETWNPQLETYKNPRSQQLRECVQKIYSSVFNRIQFPFDAELGRYIYKEQLSSIQYSHNPS